MATEFKNDGTVIVDKPRKGRYFASVRNLRDLEALIRKVLR